MAPGELSKIVALAPGVTVLVRIATSGAGADWALGGSWGRIRRWWWSRVAR